MLRMSSVSTSFSWSGVLEATLLVLVTTLDDCVWLVPFVAAAPTRRMAVIHATVFLFTLQALALLLSMGTLLVVAWRKGLNTDNTSDGEPSSMESDDSILAIVAAILCWLLAAALVYKKFQKQKRKREQQNRDLDMVEYGSIPSAETTGNEPDTAIIDDDESHTSNKTENPIMVMTLTFLGFMDEMAYFPSLILGGIFSAVELWLGTVLAGLIMLGIVTICLAPFQPIIHWLDKHVKLYGVVTVFAIILTVQVILDKL